MHADVAGMKLQFLPVTATLTQDITNSYLLQYTDQLQQNVKCQTKYYTKNILTKL